MMEKSMITNKKFNGKKLYQVELRSRETYLYLDPVYVTAYNDEEAWEKALDLESDILQCKGVTSDIVDEKVYDDEKSELREVHQTRWVCFKDGTAKLREAI